MAKDLPAHNKDLPVQEKDFYQELEVGILELSKIIKKYKKQDNLEIELRIGRIVEEEETPGKIYFESGLSNQEFYEKIQSQLEKCEVWQKKIKNKTEEYIHKNLRKTVSFNGKKLVKPTYIQKDKIYNLDLTYTNTPYDIRISVAKEIEDNDIKFKNSDAKILRKKERTSYFYKDYRIDLTEVNSIDNNGIETKTYELEVELLNLKNNVNDIYRAHSSLLLTRDFINMCETIEDGKIEINIEHAFKDKMQL